VGAYVERITGVLKGRDYDVRNGVHYDTDSVMIYWWLSNGKPWTFHGDTDNEQTKQYLRRARREGVPFGYSHAELERKGVKAGDLH
jgi:hypothetical protein